MKRTPVRRAVIVLLTALFMIGGTTSPAAADEAGGINSPYDDWNNNHQLCGTCTVDYGNIVGMWQNILHADGFLARCGSGGIDGDYGPVTGNATQDWKQFWDVGSNDRIVGTGLPPGNRTPGYAARCERTGRWLTVKICSYSTGGR